MKPETRGRAFAAALSLSLLLGGFGTTSAASAQELELKAASSWPKDFPLVERDFRRFIDTANERVKGTIRIRLVEGTNQLESLKSGETDLLFTAASYHRGQVPELDALSGTRVRPWVARLNGGLVALNAAVSKRINSRILAHAASGISFVLYLRDAPNRTADGGIDLTGLRIRSAPLYDGLLRGLGAAPVAIKNNGIYDALELGAVDGAAFPELWSRKDGWAKLVKFRVYPTFFQLEPCIFINNDSLAKLDEQSRDLLMQLGAEHEIWSYAHWAHEVEKERKILSAEFGQKEIRLEGEAAKRYLAMANRVPIERLAQLGTAEAKDLQRLYHGQ